MILETLHKTRNRPQLAPRDEEHLLPADAFTTTEEDVRLYVELECGSRFPDYEVSG